MKKGLILALTMVAMVALVMPVLALAPLVDPLPNVIIGDSEAGQIDVGTGNHLFTYNNVMNVATSSKIQWQNAGLGFLAPQMHAYYLCDPAGGVQVSTLTRLVSEVTTTDIANIASAGVAPAAAKTITDAAGDGGLSDFWWLSLATNMSGATSSYTATAAANGKTIVLTNVDPVDVTLFLADGDFPTTAVTQADSFTVYTVPTGADGISGTSGVTVYSENFDGGASNWQWAPYAGIDVGSLPTGTATGGQLVHTVGGSGALRFGTWASGTGGGVIGAVVDVQDALGSDIFRATFSLTSTSTSYTTTMAFRLLYFQLGFGHLGGITHYDANAAVCVAASAEANAPTASSPKEFKLYWAAPFLLTEMSDTGKLATVDSPRDLRHYTLNFDAIMTQTSDSGNLGLNNVLVETIDKPTGSTIVRWGTGFNAFDNADANIGWQDLAQTAGGLPLGTATRSPGGITLTAGASTSGGYKSVGLFGNATSLPTIVSDQLIICTATVATNAFNTTPTYRIINLSTLTSTGAAEALQWADVFDPNYGDLKRMYSTGNLPCAPNTTPTEIVSYIYTHTAHSAPSKINPMVDCYQVGAQPTPWPLNSGTLTMSGFKYELAN